MKYVTLPTWLLVKLLTYDIPEHPYSPMYENLDTWAAQSPKIFRLFDFVIFALTLGVAFDVLITFQPIEG